MSRRLAPPQRPRVCSQAPPDNPYQTAISLPQAYFQPPNFLHYTKDGRACNAYRNEACSNIAPYDTAISDDTCTETNSYYDFDCPYQYPCRNDFEEGRSRFYDSSKRLSKNTFPSLSKNFCRGGPFTSSSKDAQKVYPNDNTQRNATEVPVGVVLSCLADRAQSSLSSGMTSVIVDGCGGHCQTFENVCYYFLQVAFTMGILIGTSLSIAGAVLRKSAARNLQVLMYIGALLSMVSALLLAIQCSSRYSARKRKKALKNAKRAPIPMDTLHSRPSTMQQQPLLEVNQRTGLSLQVQIAPVHSQQSQRPVLVDQQGIPWWRRKDLN